MEKLLFTLVEEENNKQAPMDDWEEEDYFYKLWEEDRL